MKGSTKEGPNHLRVTLGTEPEKAFSTSLCSLDVFTDPGLGLHFLSLSTYVLTRDLHEQ